MNSDAPEANGAVAAASTPPRVSVFAAMAAVWGPGLLVMLADTDAGNVVTAAQAGSIWGFRLAPLLILLIPVLILIQDLAVRIGVFRGCGFGVLVKERFGRVGAYVAAAALIVATIGSLVTEFTGIAGVGELYGVSRLTTLPVAAAALILVAFTGEYRRVERVALIFGLFEASFLFVAWRAQPSFTVVLAQFGDQKLSNVSYLYLAAGLIGATFNPWMIFYQSSAVAEKRLSAADYPAARMDTIFGAILTQALTASVLVAIAALKIGGSGESLEDIGQISRALTPHLGETVGRLVFGAGVVGAAMAAAIVCSLACAWGLNELFGVDSPFGVSRRRQGGRFLAGYCFWVAASAALVYFVSDLVWLSVGMQVLNAVLLPVVVTLLLIIAASALPDGARIGGWRLGLVSAAIAVVAVAGLIGAATALS
jgi:Mn2+/Fe2+ NRAMP family transporter